MYTEVVANPEKMTVKIIKEGTVNDEYSCVSGEEYNISLMNSLLDEALKNKNKKVIYNHNLIKLSDVVKEFFPYINNVRLEPKRNHVQLTMDRLSQMA